MKKFLRKLHRWLGVLMILQLLAWFGSGFYFALNPIEEIRGEHLVGEAEELAPEDLAVGVGQEVAWEKVQAAFEGRARPGSVSLVRVDGRVWHRFTGTAEDAGFARLVDAETGELAPALDREDAARIARAALAVPGELDRVERVEEATPSSEFRGRRLPLWQVRFAEPEGLRVYVDPWTREIVALRTDRWRIFDFLWMLHIMDYRARDDFNTPWLQGAAALGIFIALSGILYWAMTTRLRKRRR